MDTKNFNETLFDYKQYSLINNNPIKKKTEFEKELKETKKSKDLSMKKKKKCWIKIGLIKKEKKNSELENEEKIYLSKQNQKSKNILNNLKIINEEESTKKMNEINSEEKNEENEFDFNSHINKCTQIYKKSQDDFNIDLMNNFGIDDEMNINSNAFIGKYKQYSFIFLFFENNSIKISFSNLIF